jgi:hypothetical protein
MLTARNVEESDRDLLMAAARSDPYHAAAGLTGEHWMKSAICYSDELGPVVALKTRNVVRVDIQFLTQDKARNAKALFDGFWNYVAVLRKKHVGEIIFNTESPEVAHFLLKRFHFHEVSRGTYSLCIAEG